MPRGSTRSGKMLRDMSRYIWRCARWDPSSSGSTSIARRQVAVVKHESEITKSTETTTDSSPTVSPATVTSCRTTPGYHKYGECPRASKAEKSMGYRQPVTIPSGSTSDQPPGPIATAALVSRPIAIFAARKSATADLTRRCSSSCGRK